MTKTYTLQYKQASTGEARSRASVFKTWIIDSETNQKEYTNLNECQKQQAKLLEIFDIVQIIKNSRGDKK